MKIERILLVGDLAVYRRHRKHETNIPLYFVLRVTDNKILEEFRRRESAMKWAVTNSDQSAA